MKLLNIYTNDKYRDTKLYKQTYIFIYFDFIQKVMDQNIQEGDKLIYQPKNGGEFPTGEMSRTATVEAIRGEELIVRQQDEFTNRIEENQIVECQLD